MQYKKTAFTVIEDANYVPSWKQLDKKSGVDSKSVMPLLWPLLLDFAEGSLTVVNLKVCVDYKCYLKNLPPSSLQICLVNVIIFPSGIQVEIQNTWIRHFFGINKNFCLSLWHQLLHNCLDGNLRSLLDKIPRRVFIWWMWRLNVSLKKLKYLVCVWDCNTSNTDSNPNIQVNPIMRTQGCTWPKCICHFSLEYELLMFIFPRAVQNNHSLIIHVRF